MKYILTVIILFSNCILSQNPIKTSICGNIIDAETREPIANANIFISNSSIGTASDKNGYFELRNLSYGRYEIIASVIGYEILIAKVGVYTDSRRNFRLEMYKQPIQFPEVIVSAKESWKRKSNLSRFRKALLGTRQNGKKTYISNEEVIRFKSSYGMLIAFADEPLEIINNSLGYIIQYVLDDFELTEGYVKYTGYPHFIEQIATTYHDSIDWYDNRIDTYLGSFRHFLTTICENYELTNGDTIKRPIDFKLGDVMRHNVKVTYGDTTHIEDQGFYVLKIDSLLNTRKRKSYKYYEMRYKPIGNRQLVNTNCFLTETSNPNEMYLQFDGSLEITYSDKSVPFKNINNSNGTSWIKIVSDSTILDKQGRYFDIYAIKTSGLWAKERVADMLPFDYKIAK